MSRIVVGIDGSANAIKALRWAVDYAGTGDTVAVIHVWHLPPMEPLEFPGYSLVDAEVRARLVAEQAVADAGCRLTQHDPMIEIDVRHGHSGGELIDASAEADLLVVGTRGRGGFVGLLLGSVSTYVVHHAKCPIVVVPSDG